jgi:hypothetical protein
VRVFETSAPFFRKLYLMKNLFTLVTAFLLFSSLIVAQQKSDNKKPETAANVSAPADQATLDLAKSVFAAHGGEKLHNMKTLVVRGTVNVTSAAFNQAIPGGFSMAFAGDKYRVELASAFQSFKQTFDGQQTYSSMQMSGLSLPPMNRLGFPLLQRLGSEGYAVSKLPESSKKKLGFRITAPDGFFTDYFVDEKTNQITGYESQYEYAGRTYTTSVVIEKFRSVDGIVVPEKYSQRFDLGQIVIYGDFKTKDILINTELSDDVFRIS